MSVIVVRPYTQRIRGRARELLEGAGLEMSGATVIAAGTPDDDVLAELRGSQPSALLLPYHAHRDRTGKAINGLELARRVVTECPELSGVPIFMPISATGMAAATLMLAGDAGDDPRFERVLLMPESELDSPRMASRVAAHARRGRSTWRPLG